MGAGLSVVSGKDHRSNDEPYINQMFIAEAGGPGSPSADGWPNYGLPVVAGLMYRDSVEIDELKHPLEFRYVKIVPGSGGAGKFRGSVAVETAFGPKELPVEALWPCDGTHYPPKGVRGGANGVTARHWKVSANGSEEELPNVVITTIKKGEIVRGNTTSGGGYGNPLERDPKRVLKDLLDGFETRTTRRRCLWRDFHRNRGRRNARHRCLLQPANAVRRWPKAPPRATEAAARPFRQRQRRA